MEQNNKCVGDVDNDDGKITNNFIRHLVFWQPHHHWIHDGNPLSSIIGFCILFLFGGGRAVGNAKLVNMFQWLELFIDLTNE